MDRSLDARAILSCGCYNMKINLATQHELIWDSHDLFEAFDVLAGRPDPARI